MARKHILSFSIFVDLALDYARLDVKLMIWFGFRFDLFRVTTPSTILTTILTSEVHVCFDPILQLDLHYHPHFPSLKVFANVVHIPWTTRLTTIVPLPAYFMIIHTFATTQILVSSIFLSAIQI